jgi:hypothetical protein
MRKNLLFELKVERLLINKLTTEIGIDTLKQAQNHLNKEENKINSRFRK